MDYNVSKLKATIDTIGKCEFMYDEELMDYKFNGVEIVNIKEDYYSKLKSSFDEMIRTVIFLTFLLENLYLENVY